ncbi:MAG: site-specific DNA-methyltransferase [Treponema sp.]|nr:site-specific DNA-methyltransferase [Treponema sp.]
MPEKLRPSFTVTEEILGQLKKLIPEAFKDNMLDFDALQDALSGYTEDIDSDDSFFGLYWPGKKAAKKASLRPPTQSLVPVSGDGVDEDTTKNIYIEGENLEVLKLLRKAYAGRIKMIYIDPPYNTGNDFLYKDDFSETEESFMLKTGQIDSEGITQTTNKRSDGRFHSNWCSMIYPRLKLARDLLSEDGVIFISIDDNEVAQLRKICDEIFGEENFVANLVWANKEGGGSSDSKYFKTKHEYIYCYAKEYGKLLINQDIQEEDKSYNYQDEYLSERGKYKLIKLNSFSIQYSSSLDYPIEYKGEFIYPSEKGKRGCWRWSKKRYEWGLANGYIVIKKGADGDNKIYTKQYFKVDIDGNNIIRGLPPIALIEKYSSTMASKQIEDLLGSHTFDYSKPWNLIFHIIKNATNTDSLILDFFSGSATTAHAVMQLNAEDGGNRKFIMVQIPEQCNEKSEAAKAGYKNICEIGKERIRRAGKKIKQEAGEKAKNLDIGFKVYRAESSNYKKWHDYTGNNIKEAEDMFRQFENPLVDNWKPENLLTEIMLLEGFPLDSVITDLKAFAKNTIKKIESDFCEHNLYVCLDREIHSDTIQNLSLEDNDIFICLDSAISDQDKARLDDKGQLKTI